ncbi:hypothetical protein HO173_011016 [Letharia columbiana]|uniref:Uncharacterized protein n=1 Tax=Letharia columbiana TaxID=112416 RepID=A0A8H6FLW6_9LECA|nr:uncharacterized protein HO173_011016 [Letharia columbiana]KAF6230900.1 hypothetical protein HO173_011016 [Letharia columbiana]
MSQSFSQPATQQSKGSLVETKANNAVSVLKGITWPQTGMKICQSAGQVFFGAASLPATTRRTAGPESASSRRVSGETNPQPSSWRTFSTTSKVPPMKAMFQTDPEVGNINGQRFTEF